MCVEPIWLALEEGQDGWLIVESAIDDILAETDLVVIECRGGSQGFENLRNNLANKYSIKYVRAVTPLKVCLHRVRNRDAKDHIAVSDEKVEEYNRLVVQVSLPWDVEVHNGPPMTDEMILRAFNRIQKDEMRRQ